MKITKSIKLSPGVYVLYAGKDRIFVDDDCFYDSGVRIKYQDTNQLLDWLLWTTKENLKKIK